MSILKGIPFLRQELTKIFMKRASDKSGIMQIPFKNKKLQLDIEDRVQKYIRDAQKQGVDLDMVSNENLKYTINLNENVDPLSRAISADSPEGRKITEALLGKQKAPVVDINTGKTMDTSQGIMGGKSVAELMKSGQVTKGTKGLKKSKKVQDREMFEGANKRLKNETEAEIAERLARENKESAARIKNQKMVDDAIDNASPGFAGDRKYDAQLVADDLAEKRFNKEFYDLDQKQQMDLYDEAYQGLSKKKFDPPEDMATGGRVPLAGGKKALTKEQLEEMLNVKKPKHYKESPLAISDDWLKRVKEKLSKAEGGVAGLLGERQNFAMGKRAFLKLMGGVGAGIAGLKSGLLGLGKGATKQVAKEIVTTAPVAGKPAWFDALVNKVIREGDDVTKKFATADRQSIHQKTLDDGSVVRVTEDVDDGAIRVEYDSDANVFEDTVQLQYKKPLPDEGNPNPAAQFDVAESGPVGRQVGPDDYDMDIDEVGGSSIRDLDSDVSKLEEYATGKKPTMKEFVKNKKRKDKAKRITNDPEAQSDAIVRRQGEMLDYDVPDDAFASGGIARMLGE